MISVTGYMFWCSESTRNEWYGLWSSTLVLQNIIIYMFFISIVNLVKLSEKYNQY